MDDLIRAPRGCQARAEEGRAVVALGSTIITHGIPYPQNLETAQRVGPKVHAAGADPRHHIASMDGRIPRGP